MAIDCYELKEHIIIPALAAINLYSASAVQLLLGTCAQETSLGTFILQKKIGYNGGIGIYQMESASFHAVWDKMVAPHPSMRTKIKLFLGYEGKPALQRLAGDLFLATIITRLYYYDINEPLPSSSDIEGMANYWKRFYNTEKGRGTVDQFISNYKRYVVC